MYEAEAKSTRPAAPHTTIDTLVCQSQKATGSRCFFTARPAAASMRSGARSGWASSRGLGNLSGRQRLEAVDARRLRRGRAAWPAQLGRRPSAPGARHFHPQGWDLGGRTGGVRASLAKTRGSRCADNPELGRQVAVQLEAAAAASFREQPRGGVPAALRSPACKYHSSSESHKGRMMLSA